MTCQYLVGELSVRLEQLQATAGAAAAPGVARLRTDVEAASPAGLAGVSARAMALADALCWESLSRGNIAAFNHQAEILAEIDQIDVGVRLLVNR